MLPVAGVGLEQTARVANEHTSYRSGSTRHAGAERGCGQVCIDRKKKMTEDYRVKLMCTTNLRDHVPSSLPRSAAKSLPLFSPPTLLLVLFDVRSMSNAENEEVVALLQLDYHRGQRALPRQCVVGSLEMDNWPSCRPPSYCSFKVHEANAKVTAHRPAPLESCCLLVH